MKHHQNLASIKSIVSAEPVKLNEAINSFPNPTFRSRLQKQLKKVETYRIRYKVKNLHIVGYVVIPKEGTNLPCLLHLRGGSRDFGMMVPKGIVANMLNYASEGYVVITTQYPGVEGGDGEDAFGGEDDLLSIKKLRTILQALPTADHNNIGVKGHSRGGLMTYMLLREVRWVKAAMASAAPVDQIKQKSERDGWKDHQKRMWGGDKEGALKRSPIRWIEELPIKTPLLIMQGSADWRVDPQHSIDMVSALCKQSHPNRFILFEGADHGISEYRSEYHQQTLDWFNRWLKNKEPLPNMKPHGR